MRSRVSYLQILDDPLKVTHDTFRATRRQQAQAMSQPNSTHPAFSSLAVNIERIALSTSSKELLFTVE